LKVRQQAAELVCCAASAAFAGVFCDWRWHALQSFGRLWGVDHGVAGYACHGGVVVEFLLTLVVFLASSIARRRFMVVALGSSSVQKCTSTAWVLLLEI
jgi:hypothetical protein